MLLGRLIGWALLLAGIIVAIQDGLVWYETHVFQFSSGGEVWYKVDRDSLNLAQAVVQRYLSPDIWEAGILPALVWPATATLAGLGLILLLLFRRR
jgi:hypothetical protein